MLGVLFLSALLATLVVAQSTRTRMSDNRANADTVQRLLLQRVSMRIDDFTTDAAQLSSAAATQACSIRNDRALVERLLRGLLASRINSRVYGVGCFFEPHAFSAGTGLYGPYARTTAHGFDFERNLGGSYKYQGMAWYRNAVSAHGMLAPYGPYIDVQKSYISFAKAFYYSGRLAGVASADARTESFRGVVGGEPKLGSRIYLQNAAGQLILSYGHLPANAQIVDLSAPIRFAHARVHFASDRTPTYAANRRLFFYAALVTLAIWGAGGLVAVLLLRSWRAKRKATEMELEQARLEDEITLRREVETHLRQVAYVDTLTGLANRPLVVDALNALVARRDGAPCVLSFIDIDSFSLINDTLGHESGDALLIAIAKILRDAFPNDIVARFGGDDFVVLISQGALDPLEPALRVKASFAQPIGIRGREMRLTASQGIVAVDGSYERAEDVLRDAEIAMYASKRQARGSFQVFSARMRQQVELDAQLEHDLHHAIAVDEFTVHYQPVVDLRSGAVVSLEALARWDHGGKLLPPAAFIPYAESHGLISAIDALILRKVCAEMMRFISIAPGLSVAVNCSMAQLTSDHLVALTHSLLKRHNIPASYLRLEITETSVMKNAEYALESMQRLRALGVLTLVDDFGTGYSSLAYLQRLPISGVKIDRSFITPLGQSSQATAIVRSIIALADTLGLYTVAEGIETAQQLAILVELGATMGQGFFFSKPVPPEEVQRLIMKDYRAAS